MYGALIISTGVSSFGLSFISFNELEGLAVLLLARF